MKTIFRILVTMALLLAAMVSYTRLHARWVEEERIAQIDRVIEERASRLEAEAAYRNKFAEQSIRQAAQSEQESQMRWDAAKNRAKLPGDNTVGGFTPYSNYGGGAPRVNR